MGSKGTGRLAVHLEAVGDLAYELAVKEGISPRRAREAACLHDRFKSLSPARLIGIMRKCREGMDKETRKIPELWHGWASAAAARHFEGIHDHDLLDAVRWHSTGKKGLSTLGRILFVADYCSRDRKFPDAAAGRRLAHLSLELGVRFVLASKLAYLMGEGITPHSASIGFWSSLFREVAVG